MVDLEKIIPTIVNLCMDSWMHVQEVDYDQIPFNVNCAMNMGTLLKAALKVWMSRIRN